MEHKTMPDDINKEDNSLSAPQSKHLSRWQKTYGFLGFRKGYNFPLWIIFAGAMFGFSLARAEYLNTAVYVAGALPGEWFWYHEGIYRIGIVMHLAAVVPAGLLMVWQFVPKIRHKFMIFHRINGYTIAILILFAVISALMLARRAFGGLLLTQTAIGLLAIMVVTSLGMALYNIKRLQIDQHRAWMLRMVFYSGTIITVRIIMIIAAEIFVLSGDYYATMPCKELKTLTTSSQFRNTYPQCLAQGAGSTIVPVPADFTSSQASEATIAISLREGFAIGIWLAIFLHAVGIELYLSLTPAESARLRLISYEKQLAAGLKHPGSAGLTVDRWGDAPAWEPSHAEKVEPT